MVDFSSRLFRRWSIKQAKRQLLALQHVYDVMIEKPTDSRYLVHLWVNDLEQTRSIVEMQIREIMIRRPRDLKVDVLLYGRVAG